MHISCAIFATHQGCTVYTVPVRKIVFTVESDFNSQSGNSLNVTSAELAVLLYLYTRKLEGRGPATMEEMSADLYRVARKRTLDGALAGLKRKKLIERFVTFGISNEGTLSIKAI